MKKERYFCVSDAYKTNSKYVSSIPCPRSLKIVAAPGAAIAIIAYYKNKSSRWKKLNRKEKIVYPFFPLHTILQT